MFVHAYSRVEKCKKFCSRANFHMAQCTFKIQRNSLKENLVFQFFGIFAKKCSCSTLLNSIYQFVWSCRLIWYPYCHTLWHFMSYGKCHKMAFYDIYIIVMSTLFLTSAVEALDPTILSMIDHRPVKRFQTQIQVL